MEAPKSVAVSGATLGACLAFAPVMALSPHILRLRFAS